MVAQQAWSIGFGVAVASMIVTVVLAVYHVSNQRKLADDKLRNENAFKLIDEFFGAEMYQARLATAKCLEKFCTADIDQFSQDAGEDKSVHLAAALHWMEKLYGFHIAGRVDDATIRKVLGLKLAWWYVNLIEHFQGSTHSEWSPLLAQLRHLRRLVPDAHYASYLAQYENRQQELVRGSAAAQEGKGDPPTERLPA